jgi:hypothetical protein
MKAYGGVDVQIHVFLAYALAGNKWLASSPGRLAPCTHWIGGWMDPRAGLETWRKFLTLQGLKLVANRYTDYGIANTNVDRYHYNNLLLDETEKNYENNPDNTAGFLYNIRDRDFKKHNSDRYTAIYPSA